ncbi:uncharacterized protein EI90DRAFT_3013703 [Cantharellus anzutake]|uniref:uncharacterized protein n=1 Tax=Cantharellus anzutake TaxID=1750568 RepID=UPI001907FE5A|nr:uncharacterized protein EI90DRAFT_3013703 [Cantharellus anzutake]KAF8337500.1 hypothetical protein EI90DRAFT_3013703 [Cantharellus anzutake]
MDSKQSTCPCCGKQGLSKRTIRRHLQRLEQDISDNEMILSGNDDLVSKSDSSSYLSDDVMNMSDMDNSTPNTPLSSHHDEPPLPSCWNALDTNEMSNEPVNTLAEKFSGLSLILESHFEPEVAPDLEDDVDPLTPQGVAEPRETGYESGGDSDGDSLMGSFYDLGLDEELRDIYRFNIQSLSEEDIDSIKMFNFIRNTNLSRKAYAQLAKFWGSRIHIESLYKDRLQNCRIVPILP